MLNTFLREKFNDSFYSSYHLRDSSIRSIAFIGSALERKYYNSLLRSQHSLQTLMNFFLSASLLMSHPLM